MPFSSKLPEWFATGLEPNASQKLTGYQIGVRPPSQWFNWHLNLSYLALKELQENAVHKDEIESRFNAINIKTVTLNAGVQIITAVKSALFSLDGATGRMLVNLLGRMGNCESVGLWSSNTTIATDTANKTSGTSSFKLTLGSVPATASASFLTTPGKKYVAIADVKNGNTSKAAISINGIAGAAGNEVTSASVFAPSVVRFAATDYFHIVTITGTGAAASTFNMDSVRVYEVSDADYAAAASYTPAQAAAKWPYVDSVMPVRNPYAIRYGENLIPSFYQWTLGDRAKSLNPYKLETVATVSVDQSNVYVPVSPGAAYTFTAKVNGRVTVVEADATGLETNVYSTTDNENRVVTVTFTTKTTTKGVKIYATNTGAGTFTLENPMLNIGSTAKPFKPREDSMLALQTDLYADPVTGANADTVYERDGRYFKSKKWKGLVLDGNQPWTYFDKDTGYKVVRLVVTDGVTNSEIVTKYDGKLIPHAFPVSSADQSYLSASSTALGLSISVVDSGWADGYQPDQDDIKAYFFGYKAYDANTITPANAQAMTTATWTGTGTKYWVQRVGAPAFTQTVPQQAYAGYTPYQIVYRLATPTVEPIVSEGQLSFVEGDNQIEVGTGIVLRERTTPVYESNGNYQINNSNLAGSTLRNKVEKIENVLRNGVSDKAFTIFSYSTAYGKQMATIYASNYEQSAAYSVTYLMLDKSPVASFVGSYAANEKTLLTDLVDSVQQNTARVSVLENKKADKDNPAWITPTTLLNGWVSMGVLGYRKKDNIVQVKARIKSGVIGQPFMVLLEGYRPLVGQVRPVHSYTTTDVFAAVLINADGKFIVSGGSNNEVNIYLEFTTD